MVRSAAPKASRTRPWSRSFDARDRREETVEWYLLQLLIHQDVRPFVLRTLLQLREQENGRDSADCALNVVLTIADEIGGSPWG